MSFSYQYFGIGSAIIILLGAIAQFVLYKKGKSLWYAGLPGIVFIGVWCMAYWLWLRDPNMSQTDKSNEQWVFLGTIIAAAFLFVFIPLMAISKAQ